MMCNRLQKATLFCFLFCSLSWVYGEKSVLLELKSSFSDPSGVLSSWDPNNTDCCSWHGVSCNSKREVVSLNIPGDCDQWRGNLSPQLSTLKYSQFPFHGFGIERTCLNLGGKLRGKLLPLIGMLTELEVLSLPFNELSGDMPAEIWGLKKLEVINLEGNLFTGKLPKGFIEVKRLRVLNLGFNRLDDEIPISLSTCVDLEVLNLAGNRLKGSVPIFLGAFKQLRGLYLANNELSGTISTVFESTCHYLEHLDLSGNFLIGQIPGNLGNCRCLRTLLLSSNVFSGPIPHELGRLRRLEVLDVSRNNISGSIPADLGNCLDLAVLVLSNLFETWLNENDIIGKVPDQLTNVANYEFNQFQGPIPTKITTLPKLGILWAPKASLKGTVPADWGACKSLQMVNLAHNGLSGEVNGVFKTCKKLYHLDLSSNRLSGQLDEELPVPCMIIFDVSQNLMSGPIPRFNYRICSRYHSSYPGLDLVKDTDPLSRYLSLFMHRTLQASHLPFSTASSPVIHNFSGNNFTGSIRWIPVRPGGFGTRTDYAFLASGNQLTGAFPGSLFVKCSELYGMIVNISKNRIRGSIPLKIGAMCRSLRCLDASNNQISGTIPASLGELKSLVTLDFSGNKLQGQIPSTLYQLKFLKHVSFAGNNVTGFTEDIVNSQNLTAPVLDRSNISGQKFSGFQYVRSLFTVNEPNGLYVALPKSSKGINCSNNIKISFRNAWSTMRLSKAFSSSSNSSDYQQQSKANDSGFNTIEIVSIVCASAIVSILLVLVFLFFYTKRKTPNARVEVAEPKQVKVFVDIGVPLLYENIVRATGNFNASNCIGNGGFGSTYKAELSPGTLVAIKRLAIGRFQGAQQFHAEIKALGRVTHPNLVTLIGYHASETEMFLIYNYFPGGNLEDLINERSTRGISWKTLHKIALHIASALAYLHDRCIPKVLHRDVKPSNILLDDDLNAYLSDFGLARLLGTSETHATTGVAGTFGYVAPEYAMTCRVSEKADVYSYGVVLLELLSDKKALDPSFSVHENGFNIVSWACMLLRHGRAKEVFNAGLWDSSPRDDLVDMLHVAVTCTVDTLSHRPTMMQVVQNLKQIQPS
ncbi:hypothetical protein K2173_015321 [Erythroxylum novogranatense]|uniref:non-specific serine/threonine protein kinase n=1 Tax=Erythroxylum novogranatense TaxID=1862640 RepID=A0AAV8T2P8_9ROSI|nr:hypothetical protein K2173_015321 [Erythroxylum novogranatense]